MSGWVNYDDVGEVYELNATYDDALKKDNEFIIYAVKIANRILMDNGIKAHATWGKWGARLEPKVNQHLNRTQIETVASQILNSPAWDALRVSTQVFTYGKFDDAIYDFQKNGGFAVTVLERDLLQQILTCKCSHCRWLLDQAMNADKPGHKEAPA